MSSKAVRHKNSIIRKSQELFRQVFWVNTRKMK